MRMDWSKFLDSSQFTSKDLCLDQTIPFIDGLIFLWLFMTVSMSDYTSMLPCVLYW